MKRDMDLVRAILLKIESSEGDPRKRVMLGSFEGHSNIEVSYHVKLLAQAGLIEARDHSTFSGFAWVPQQLTWDGHEFLDAARSDNLWKQAKNVVLKQTGGLSLEVLKPVLINLAKQAVEP